MPFVSGNEPDWQHCYSDVHEGTNHHVDTLDLAIKSHYVRIGIADVRVFYGNQKAYFEANWVVCLGHVCGFYNDSHFTLLALVLKIKENMFFEWVESWLRGWSNWLDDYYDKNKPHLGIRPLASSQNGILCDLVPPIVIIRMSAVEQRDARDATSTSGAHHIDGPIRILPGGGGGHAANCLWKGEKISRS